MTFDLACFFFGDHAYQAATEDGIDPGEVNNDYYIRNTNPETRDVPVSGEAVAWEIGVVGDDHFEPIPWDEWPTNPEQGCHCQVWLYITTVSSPNWSSSTHPDPP